MKQGFRDRIIERLADQEYALARDLAANRELLHLALVQLHQVGRELGHLREQHGQLRDECRRLRAQVPCDERRTA